jgi:hypothetical protein
MLIGRLMDPSPGLPTTLRTRPLILLQVVALVLVEAVVETVEPLQLPLLLRRSGCRSLLLH